jgi:hypothetical protein
VTSKVNPGSCSALHIASPAAHIGCRCSVAETFDAVLANPPFVAIPSAVSAELDRGGSACSHLSWALFAAGGPSGDAVLRRVVEGAADHLGPGGWLGVVTEVPNVRQAGIWLAPLLGRRPSAGASSPQPTSPPPSSIATL